MPLFSRSLKPGTEEALPLAEDEAAPEASPRHTIGELLRDTRKSYGGEIDRIAATLRIRAAYLSAIEENQYDKLPGPVYAQGFVRAYAVHLGLDGDEAVRRFKHEIEGFQVSRDLSFPVPLAARSIPGGTMLLAALILAICGYGLWYYISTGDRAHPERVSAVPSDFVAGRSAPPTPAAATKTPAPAQAAVPASTSAAPAASSPPASTASTTAPAAPAAPPPISPAAGPAAAPPSAASSTVASSPAQTAAPPAAPAATTAPASTPAPDVSSPAGSAPAAAAPPASNIAATPATPATASPPSAANPNAATPTPVPRVYGVAANIPARIVIHAIKDSWVQVRSDDHVLTERLLHPGDSVRVPDQPGLTLKTGNGAGIELEVDGNLGKPLSGTVRTLALDPDGLTDGVVPKAPKEPAALQEPPLPNQ